MPGWIPAVVEQLVRLAETALRAGADPEEVARALGAALAESGAESDFASLIAACRESPADRERLLRAIEDSRRGFPGTTVAALAPDVDCPSPGIEQPEARDAGRYEVGEVIGAGGMGEVLVALDRRLRRRIAVKRMHGTARSTVVTRFLQEAQVTAQLEHPNVVPVYDFDMDGDGRPFYTMRRIQGRTLAAIVKNGDAGSLVARLDVFRKVCDAVAFAHARGVIHRDLKPSNVMVGRFGEVLVLDWGIARVTGSPEPSDDAVSSPSPPTGERLTRADAVLGTPAYMAPEQAEGRVSAVTVRSDVYSLGAILYTLLTETPPFSGASGILERVAAGGFERPAVRARGRVARDLDAVVCKAMAHTSEDRYATVEELRADVQAFLEGRAVSARRWSLPERATRWAGRHRYGVLTVALAVATAAVVTLATGAVYVGRLQRAVARAVRAEREAALHLAGGQVAVAQVYATTGRTDDARSLLGEARNLYDRYGGATAPADLVWSWVDQLHPPPLMRWTNPDGESLPHAHAGPGGDRIITVDGRRVVRVHRLPEGSLVARRAMDGEIAAVGFVRDRPVAVVLAPGGLDVTDVERGAVLLSLSAGEVVQAVLSDDGTAIATTTADGSTRAWSTSDGSPIGPRLPRAGNILGVGPGGRRILGYEGRPREPVIPERLVLWDGMRGTAVAAFPGSGIGSTLSPSGDWIALATDGRIAVARASDGSVVWEVAAEGSEGALISPDGIVVAYSPLGVIRSYSMADGREIGHQDLTMTPAEVIAGGGMLATHWSSWALWPLARNDWADPVRIDAEFTAVAVSPDGVLALTGGFDGVLRLWEPDSGRLLREYRACPDGTRGVAFSPDGGRILSADRDGTVRLWDAAGGWVLDELPRPGTRAQAAVFLPDGRRVIAVWRSGEIGIWDTESGGFRRFAEDHAGTWTLRLSPDGRLAVTTGRDLTSEGIRVWDVEAGRTIFSAPSGNSNFQARFSPDGRSVAVGRHGHGPAVWTSAAGAAWSFHPLPDTGQPVMAVEWTQDGSFLVVGAWDGKLRVYDARSRDELAVLPIEDSTITDLAALPGGRRVVAVFGNGRLRTVDLDRHARLDAVDPRQVGDDIVTVPGPEALLRLGRGAALRGDWARAAGLLEAARQAGARVPDLEIARAGWVAGDRASAAAALDRAVLGGEILPGTAAIWRAALGPAGGGAERP